MIPSGLRARRGYFALAAGVLAADQLTKIWAHAVLRDAPHRVLIPDFFHLAYSRNRGGLFGYFSDFGDPWRTLLLTFLPLAAVALIARFLARADVDDRPTLLGLGAILGGATGNLVDRVFRGEVVDFLDVFVVWTPLRDPLVRTFGTAHWPTFNVADSAIVCGAGLLLWSVFRGPSEDVAPGR